MITAILMATLVGQCPGGSCPAPQSRGFFQRRQYVQQQYYAPSQYYVSSGQQYVPQQYLTTPLPQAIIPTAPRIERPIEVPPVPQIPAPKTTPMKAQPVKISFTEAPISFY